MKQDVKIVKCQGGKRNQMLNYPFISLDIYNYDLKDNVCSGEGSFPWHNRLGFTCKNPMEG